jgi:hypothetical protein
MAWGHQEARSTGAGPGSGTRLLERGGNRAFERRYRPCANVNIHTGGRPEYARSVRLSLGGSVDDDQVSIFSA